jgi:hypothetical protein
MQPFHEGVSVMSGHRYTVEFRFSGDSLDIERISREMMLEPSTSLLPSITTAGRRRGAVWGYDGYDEEGFVERWSSLGEGLAFLFDRLDSKIPTIRELSKDYEGIWWCGHFQSSFDGGPLLGINIIEGLQKFRVPIFIDNYFSK